MFLGRWCVLTRKSGWDGHMMAMWAMTWVLTELGAWPLNTAHGSLSIIRILKLTKLAGGRLALTKLLRRILYDRYQFVHVQWEKDDQGIRFSQEMQCWCFHSEESGQHEEAGAARSLLWEFRTELMLFPGLTWCFYIHSSRMFSSRTRVCSAPWPGTSSHRRREVGSTKLAFLACTSNAFVANPPAFIWIPFPN